MTTARWTSSCPVIDIVIHIFHTQAVQGVYERLLYHNEFEAKFSIVQGKEPGDILYVCYCEPKLMISFSYAEKLPPGFFFLHSSPEKKLYFCLLWQGTRLGPTVHYVQIQRAGRCVTCTPLCRLLSPDRSEPEFLNMLKCNSVESASAEFQFICYSFF